jgi:hypothetical protein
VPNAISLKAFGTIFNSNDAVPGTVTAFVDPIISFAPGFDSTVYSILVSPGIINGDSMIPEPASFTLAGLALAGVILRRRKNRSA